MTKKRDNIKCKYCEGSVTTRELESLSVKSEPIIEIEAHCISCNRSYII